jgi:hypothetical protein
MLTRTHADIDRRIKRLVTACVLKIDRDPLLISRAKTQVLKWENAPLRAEWLQLLVLPWTELREKLLADTEEADRIRQSAPFGGFLSNQERFSIFNQS